MDSHVKKGLRILQVVCGFYFERGRKICVGNEELHDLSTCVSPYLWSDLLVTMYRRLITIKHGTITSYLLKNDVRRNVEKVNERTEPWK
jgi:hypothetical protein